MTLDNRLPDDLDEIARSLPAVPRSYSRLRQLLALLPNPIAAATQGSFPVDENAPPEADPVEANQTIGTTPGTTLMDGAIKSGQIAPGAVTGAAFASTIRPVILVHGKPSLPNASYPVDTFIYDLDDTPAKTLWKNVANVWTRIIGPGDIQADSITAGQIAAGAVSTSELAVGARLTGEVANETGLTPGVFIDTTGILIRSGKLTLQDEFGTTAMQASGFDGTWRDFLGAGLYNAAFVAGINGALTLGRTSGLPYWTVARDDVGAGTPDFANDGGAVLTRAADSTMPGGFRVRVTFSGVNDNGYLISDRVPVVAGSSYFARATIAFNRTAGNLGVTFIFRWLNEAGGTISNTLQATHTVSVTTAAAQYLSTSSNPFAYLMKAPADARFVQAIVQGFETSHNASNSVDFGSLAFARAIDDFEVDTDAALEVGSLYAWDYITIDSGGLLRTGGTSFPSSPLTNDLYYRTDIGEWFRYDGTRWRCTVNHEMPIPYTARAALPLSATQSNNNLANVPDLQGGSDIWLVEADCNFYVTGGTGLSGSHKWVIDLQKTVDGATTQTTIATFSIDDGSSDVWRTETPVAINALMNNGTTHRNLIATATKTGTPGTLYYSLSIIYNHVAT